MRKRGNIQPLPEDDAPISKSQRKRDAQAVLELSKTIVELGPKLFSKLDLSDQVREAAELARSIGAYGGRKRQLHYLGKLMRNTDLDGIRAQLQAIEDHAEINRRAHKQLEQWRDRLIDEGDGALAELIEKWPNTDSQSVRQLIRNARREREKQLPPKSSRALFQYLKTL